MPAVKSSMKNTLANCVHFGKRIKLVTQSTCCVLSVKRKVRIINGNDIVFMKVTQDDSGSLDQTQSRVLSGTMTEHAWTCVR